MASPISPMEILQIGKFAFDLYKKCKEASGEFVQIGKEVLAMRTSIEIIRMECKDPESIINKVDTKEKMIRKKLRVYFENCDGALKDVDKALEKYQKMNALQKTKWALFGKEEIGGLKSNLSSFGTQLDSYVDNVTRQGVALVNKNVVAGLEKLDNIEITVGGLEQLLEKHNGDSKATVGEAVSSRKSRRTKPTDEDHYQQVITDYLEEINIVEVTPTKAQPSTPPAQSDGNAKPNAMEVKETKPRPGSTGKNDKSKKPSPKLSKLSPKKGKHTLECWLVQVKTTDVGLFTTRKMEKERMVRGQWKLEQMANQFKSSKKSNLASNDKLVEWVLEDRRKEETNSRFTWHSQAAKIEDKGSTYLGMKVEHQAMVIIRRQLTFEAQKKADKELAEQKKKEVERKQKQIKQKLEVIKQNKEVAAKEKKELGNKKPLQDQQQKEQEQQKIKGTQQKTEQIKKKQIEVKEKKKETKEKTEETKKKTEETKEKNDGVKHIKNETKEKKAEAKKKKEESKVKIEPKGKREEPKGEKGRAEQNNKNQAHQPEEQKHDKVKAEKEKIDQKQQHEDKTFNIKRGLRESSVNDVEKEAGSENRESEHTTQTDENEHKPCWYGNACYNIKCVYWHEMGKTRSGLIKSAED